MADLGAEAAVVGCEMGQCHWAFHEGAASSLKEGRESRHLAQQRPERPSRARCECRLVGSVHGLRRVVDDSVS